LADEEVTIHRTADRIWSPTGGERTSVEEVCRKMGISQATFFRWKKVYGGLMPSEVRKLKQLQEENLRLRKLVADLMLDKEMLTEVIKKKM
jgi:putative transposase